MARDDIRARFEAKVDMTADGCWEWTGYRNAGGYGRARFAGRKELAHRVAWTLWVGEIPAGALVLHRCDNPPCVNPEHLFLGSDADNNADMRAKGRNAVGSANGRAKVTEAQVVAIRARCAAGESRRSVAADYGICHKQVGEIVHRRTWAHVL